jgi:hypothetical protein
LPSGRAPEDFEIRILSMALVAVAFEASQEWFRRDGRGSMFELVDQALDTVQMGRRLDALASTSPTIGR